jgi:hypothetical protein
MLLLYNPVYSFLVIAEVVEGSDAYTWTSDSFFSDSASSVKFRINANVFNQAFVISGNFTDLKEEHIHARRVGSKLYMPLDDVKFYPDKVLFYWRFNMQREENRSYFWDTHFIFNTPKRLNLTFGLENYPPRPKCSLHHTNGVPINNTLDPVDYRYEVVNVEGVAKDMLSVYEFKLHQDTERLLITFCSYLLRVFFQVNYNRAAVKFDNVPKARSTDCRYREKELLNRYFKNDGLIAKPVGNNSDYFFIRFKPKNRDGEQCHCVVFDFKQHLLANTTFSFYSLDLDENNYEEDVSDDQGNDDDLAFEDPGNSTNVPKATNNLNTKKSAQDQNLAITIGGVLLSMSVLAIVVGVVSLYRHFKHLKEENEAFVAF